MGNLSCNTHDYPTKKTTPCCTSMAYLTARLTLTTTNLLARAIATAPLQRFRLPRSRLCRRMKHCSRSVHYSKKCAPQDELVKDLHASLARGQAALHDQISLAQGEGEVVDLLAINDVVEATLAVYQQRVEESVMMADTRNETEEEQQQQQLEAAAASTTSLVVGVPVRVEAPSVVEAPSSAASFEDQLIDLLGAAAPAAPPAAASASASVPSKSDAQLDAEANNLLAEFDSLIGEMGGDAGNNTQEVVAQPVTS